MAYDGIFIKAQIDEIIKTVQNEHISKIATSTSKDAIFYVHKNGKNYALVLNANANFPHLLLTTNDIENMKTPTGFCMLLRKYLNGGIIKNIYQVNAATVGAKSASPSFERIVKIEIENIDDSGDIKTYFVFFEIMGKYSNIIITDETLTILDVLLKSNIENARLKQKNIYSIKEIANKKELANETTDSFIKIINSEKTYAKLNNETYDIANAISKNYAGISKPFVISSLVDYSKSVKLANMNNKLINTMRAPQAFAPTSTISQSIAPTNNINYFNYATFEKLFNNNSDYEKFLSILKQNLNQELRPCIHYKSVSTGLYDKPNDDAIVASYTSPHGKPNDFYLYKLNQYEGELVCFDSLNALIETYVKEKYSTINDSNDKAIISDTIKKLYTKLSKKISIYEDDLAKSEDFKKYKNYGELISAFAYDEKNIIDNVLVCNDYNNGNVEVKIPLDNDLSIAKNVEKYYNRYNKLKRTRDNATKLIEEVNEKLNHLDSIKSSLELTNDRNDLFLIRKELSEYFDETKTLNINLTNGTAKNNLKSNEKNKFAKNNKSKSNKKSNELNYNIHHYKSSSGIDIYVGKNNLQNEYLTFTMANPSDTWLHIKGSTGSHVIIKGSYENIDERTLIEGASLAAYFSDKKNETKATVDYTLRKKLKKVKGKAPGFCIYHKNYSINVKPEILIKEI